MDPVFSQFVEMLPVLIYPVVLIGGLWFASRQARQEGSDIPQDRTPWATSGRELVAALGATEVDGGFLGLGALQARGTFEGRDYELRVGGNEGSTGAEVRVAVALPEGVAVKEEGFFSATDPTVGVEAFDSVVHLSGPPDWLSAAFDAESRGLLLSLQSWGPYRLRDGEVWAMAGLLGDGGDAVRAVHACCRLANRLDFDAAEVPGRLAVAAQGRDRAAELAGARLMGFHPASPEAQAYASSAPGSLARLAGVLRGEPSTTLHPLLEGRDAELAECAAVLLGARGTVDSVQALRGVARGRLKDVATDAVRAIQSRVSVDGGGLSVVDSAGGELSLAADARGGLSIEPTS